MPLVLLYRYGDTLYGASITKSPTTEGEYSKYLPVGLDPGRCLHVRCVVRGCLR